jgi:hypothetical protein
MSQIAYSSIQRSTGTDSNWQSFANQTLKGYRGCRLKQYTSVNSAYNVTSTNNTLDISIADDNIGTGEISYTITIGEGSYDLTDMLTILKSAIDVAINPLTSTLAVNSLTGKLSISVSGGKYIKVRSTGGLNLMLGFSRSTDTIFGLTLTAGRMFNLIRYNNIYLTTNIIKDQGWVDALQEKVGLLGSIPIGSVPFGSQISYEPVLGEFMEILPSEIGSITFTLFDDEGNAIDLNGLYCTIVLECI